MQFNTNDDPEQREIAILLSLSLSSSFFLSFFCILCGSICDAVAAWESFSLAFPVAPMLAAFIYLSPSLFIDATFQLMRWDEVIPGDKRINIRNEYSDSV